MVLTKLTACVFSAILLATTAAQDAAKTDLAALQGEWKMVSSTRDGAKLPPTDAAKGKRTCEGDITTVTVGNMLIMKAKFTLDPAKDPKAIDYQVLEGPFANERQLGIYEIKGDEVKFCFAPPAKPRPDAFESKQGDGRTLSVWKKSEERGR